VICCLYEMLFPNGKRYFGVTNNFSRRMSEHRGDARRGSNLLVHAAMRKYGAAVIARQVVVGTREYILDLEIKAVATYETEKRSNGYNISLGGYLPSEEMREQNRQTQLRRYSDPKERLKLSQQTKGRIKTPEECARISAALTGRTRSKEHAANISKGLKGRKRPPEETDAWLAALTPEGRSRMGAPGLPKKGIADSNKARAGYKHTPEARAKMSAAVNAAGAKKKSQPGTFASLAENKRQAYLAKPNQETP